MTPNEMRQEGDYIGECRDESNKDTENASLGVRQTLWRVTAELCERLDRLIEILGDKTPHD